MSLSSRQLQDAAAEAAMHREPPSLVQDQRMRHILVNVFRETFVDVEDDALGPAQADDHQEYRDKLRQIAADRKMADDEAEKLQKMLLETQRTLDEAEEEFRRQRQELYGDNHDVAPCELPNMFDLLDDTMYHAGPVPLITPYSFIEDREQETKPRPVGTQMNFASSTTAASMRRKATVQAFPHLAQLSQGVNGDVWADSTLPQRQFEYPSEKAAMRRNTQLFFEKSTGYLRNPRHSGASFNSLTRPQNADHQTTSTTGKQAGKTQQKHAGTSSKTAQTATAVVSAATAATAPPVLFRAEPPTVLFDSYSRGETAVATLRLRNISTVTCTLRLKPPVTGHFALLSMSLPRSAKADGGGLAPGLAAECRIAFTPEHLGSYTDQLTVVPENGAAIVVPLVGERHSPGLTLPATLDCGYTLLRHHQDCSFPFRNTGGAGKCRIVTPEHLQSALHALATASTAGNAAGSTSSESGDHSCSAAESVDHRSSVPSISASESEAGDLVLNERDEGSEKSGSEPIFTSLQNGSKSRQPGPSEFLPTPDQIARLPAEFWELGDNDTEELHLPPFIVGPACLHLQSQARGQLDVTFSPRTAGTASVTLFLVFDNGSYRQLTIRGVGEVPDVLVEGSGCNVDVYGRPTIVMDGVLPSHSRSHTLRITNVCHLPLTLCWRLSKPANHDWPPAVSRFDFKNTDNNLQSEVVEGLAISPGEFILQAQETIDTIIHFEPGDLHPLVAQAVAQLTVRPSGASRRCTAVSTDSSSSLGVVAPVSGAWPPSTRASVGALRMPIPQILHEVLVEGLCANFDLSMQPAALSFGGAALVGESYTALLTLTNAANEPVGFSFAPCVTRVASISVEPHQGMVPAKGHIRVQAKLRPRRAGNLHSALVCHFPSAAPLTMPVFGQIVQPTLRVEQSALQLGLMRLGRTVYTRLTLKNPASVALSARVFTRSIQNKAEGDGSPEAFSLAFQPSLVTVAPAGTAHVKVAVSAKHVGRLQTAIMVESSGGSQTAVAVDGMVQQTACCFERSTLSFAGLYVSKPATLTAVLRNLSALPTHWQWRSATPLLAMTPHETQLNAFAVRVHPSHGVLAAAGAVSIFITLSVTRHNVALGGGLATLFDIEGMSQPLPLGINVSVKGLDLSLELLPRQTWPQQQRLLGMTAKQGHPPPWVLDNLGSDEADSTQLALTEGEQTSSAMLLTTGLLGKTAGMDSRKSSQDSNINTQDATTTMRGDSGGVVAMMAADSDDTTASGRQSSDVQPLMMDFGRVPLNYASVRILRLRNLADLDAVVLVDSVHLRAPELPPYEEPTLVRGRLQASEQLTPLDVLRRTGSRHGAVFAPSKKQVLLPPFGTVDVPIFAFVDGWGHYEDTLVLAGAGLRPVQLGLRVHAVGCPLVTSLAGTTGFTPLLRLPHCAVTMTDIPSENGAFSATRAKMEKQTVAHSSRTLAVKNTAPLPVMVSWEACHLPQDSQQAVDLLPRWEEVADSHEEDGLTANERNGDRTAGPRFRLRLGIRIHEGRPNAKVFSISHSRQVVPPGATAEVKVTFGALRAARFHGILRGQISIATAAEAEEMLGRAAAFRPTPLAPREVVAQVRKAANAVGVRPPAMNVRVLEDVPAVSSLWAAAVTTLQVPEWRTQRLEVDSHLYDVRALLVGEGVTPALQHSADDRTGLSFEVSSSDLEVLQQQTDVGETSLTRRSRVSRSINVGSLGWTVGRGVARARAHQTLVLWNTTTLRQVVAVEAFAPFKLFLLPETNGSSSGGGADEKSSLETATEGEQSSNGSSSSNLGAQNGRASVVSKQVSESPSTLALRSTKRVSKADSKSSVETKTLALDSTLRDTLLKSTLGDALSATLGGTLPVTRSADHMIPLKEPIVLEPGRATTVAVAWQPPTAEELLQIVRSLDEANGGGLNIGGGRKSRGSFGQARRTSGAGRLSVSSISVPRPRLRSWANNNAGHASTMMSGTALAPIADNESESGRSSPGARSGYHARGFGGGPAAAGAAPGGSSRRPSELSNASSFTQQLQRRDSNSSLSQAGGAGSSSRRRPYRWQSVARFIGGAARAKTKRKVSVSTTPGAMGRFCYELSDELLLVPAAGPVQRVPLTARVLLPKIKVSTAALDFQQRLVGCAHMQTVELENVGDADCHWRATIVEDNAVGGEENMDTATRAAFRCVPSQGELDGRRSLIACTKVVLQILFTPAMRRSYRGELQIHVEETRQVLCIELEGQGSHDEMNEE